MKNWNLLSSKTIMSNEHFDIIEDTCSRDGVNLSPYYTVKQTDAVVICPITENGKIVLIKQYRHPVREIGIELPAGHLFVDESIEDAVKRELMEETGYEGSSFENVGAVYSSAGLQNNTVHMFIVEGARKTSEQHLDEHEDIEVFEATVEEALELLAEGKIKDMGSYLGLMLAKEKRFS